MYQEPTLAIYTEHSQISHDMSTNTINQVKPIAPYPCMLLAYISSSEGTEHIFGLD